MNLGTRYLELIKKALLNELYVELEAQLLFAVLCSSHKQQLDLDAFWRARTDGDLREAIDSAKEGGEMFMLQGKNERNQVVPQEHLRNYIEYAHTLIGRRRLDHLQQCVETVLDEEIPGDLVECGVWRGGSCILMKAVLVAREVRDRKVWLADSFEGVPPPSLEQDRGLDLSRDRFPFLAVSREEVRELFERYQLLDDSVVFLEGWFRVSLPKAPIEKIAVLRIDGDLYESTRDALAGLYYRVSPGGFVIVDDYGTFPQCRNAVDEFRRDNGIAAPIEAIDNHGAFWRKSLGESESETG